jgi:signal transduction histidine kinase/ActR/RegA family two-component response regulator
MFGLLIATIVANASYLVFRLNHDLLEHAMEDNRGRLNLVFTLHKRQIEENSIVANIVREQNQKLCDFLDYDNVKALTYMLKTLATIYNIDLVILFNENGNLITTYPSGASIADPSLYQGLLNIPSDWNGVGVIGPAILKEQYADEDQPVNGSGALSYISSVTLLHDTGDVYGRVVLSRFIQDNSKLAETMAGISDMEVTYYDASRNPIFSTLESTRIPFPLENRMRVNENDFFAAHKEIVDHNGRSVGYLAVAFNEDLLLKHRNQIILNSLLPLIVAAVISLAIFLLLRNRVFNKIRTLSSALQQVTRSSADFSIRIPAPSEDEAAACNEVESMALDFNRMMAKLDHTYGQMVAAQREVEIANRELEERVQQRTTELSQMNTSLRTEIEERKRVEEEQRQLELQLQRAKRMEAIGTLAGGVAHDLNNILSGVVSYPELILLGLPEDSPIRKPLTTIQQSGQKAAAIVQDLLTLARRGVFETSVLNLNEIVKEYLHSPEFFKLQADHPDVQLVTRLEKNPFNINGVPIHLSKIVMNLVFNAFEAIRGEGCVVINTENSYIDRPFSGYDHVQEGDYVMLSISDSGSGIDKEDIDHIFEPFFSRKKIGRSGSGLGLTVVWAAVQDHQGYIDVHSDKNEGTTFNLYFPMTERDLDSEAKNIQLEDYFGQGEHILVVDDVAEQIEISSEMLKNLKYKVSAVSSGEAAVEFIKNHRVDLVILDMIMEPGIDGLETYRRIRDIHMEQKAIIASGFAESDRVKAALALGVAKFIKKPYHLKEIGRAIGAVLYGDEE